MWSSLKNFGRVIVPQPLFRALQPYWHGGVAVLSNYYFGQPSRKLTVIGVTGTNGKTTTVNLIAAILNQAGLPAGFLSTANYDLGTGAILNPYKMTMMSGWEINKRLSQMVKNGLKYAVVEVSSEGLAQNRHLGLRFDTALFTNLTPEHLDAHGSFEAYKKAKGRLFATGPNTIIVNADDTHAQYYSSFPANHHLSYGVNSGDICAKEINIEPNGIKFKVHDISFSLHLKGQFDVYNSLAAIAVAKSYEVNLQTAKTALEQINVVPGRVEIMQKSPFTVVVDYAYEPEEMRQLYETVSRWPHGKIIQVIGPTGGGRDKARIKTLGQMAGKVADTVIITTDDPYDEDPQTIGEEMAEGTKSSGKEAGRDLLLELDRRKAIALALRQAQNNDLVLVTGKGADQKMALAHGQYLPWDDRTVVKEELSKL